MLYLIKKIVKNLCSKMHSYDFFNVHKITTLGTDDCPKFFFSILGQLLIIIKREKLLRYLFIHILYIKKKSCI